MSRDPSRPNVKVAKVRCAPSTDETAVDRLIRLLFAPDSDEAGEGKSPARQKEREEDAPSSPTAEAR